nr:hypothetical protein [Vineibacter terrae]
MLKIGNTTVTTLREFLDRHRHLIADFIQAADEHRLLKIGPAA